jgi:hypothetical protein
MRLGMKVQIFGEGLHYRILRACSPILRQASRLPKPMVA